MVIDPDHRRAVAEVLEGPRGTAVIRLMHELATVGHPSDPSPEEAAAAARSLGWIDERGKLTPRGRLASSPLRELVWWEERGRTLSYANDFTDILVDDLYRGRRVVELGCGFGVNLLTMQQHAALAVGVEYERYFLTFTEVLARRAGLPRPSVVLGDASRVPLEDRSADVVVVLGALQMMPIRQVLGEIARLLVPGGATVLVNSCLAAHLSTLRRELPGLIISPKRLVREGLTLANAAVYPLVGRRLTGPQDAVFVRRQRMNRWLEQAGFQLDHRRSYRLGGETCWVGVRS